MPDSTPSLDKLDALKNEQAISINQAKIHPKHFIETTFLNLCSGHCGALSRLFGTMRLRTRVDLFFSRFFAGFSTIRQYAIPTTTASVKTSRITGGDQSNYAGQNNPRRMNGVDLQPIGNNFSGRTRVMPNHSEHQHPNKHTRLQANGSRWSGIDSVCVTQEISGLEKSPNRSSARRQNSKIAEHPNGDLSLSYGEPGWKFVISKMRTSERNLGQNCTQSLLFSIGFRGKYRGGRAIKQRSR